MRKLERLKEKIQEEASDNPEKFFAVDKIRKRGFKRSKCNQCGKYFWSTDPDRKVCGEAECSEGYSFINDPPTDKTFDFTSAWKEFKDFMSGRGYTPIGRYPVVARWRDDTEFVRASIYDFQPYVVSGEVEPPANPLIVPQFSLRFNDIDNVGVTGRHYTGFTMVGQHAFKSPEEYDQDKYFEDMLDWIVEGMGIPKEKVVLHEDSWGGGGNLGACMEFFVDGLELFNQVYMFYEIDNSERGYSELDTKVLDMGLGYERVIWITHGSETSYEANMPNVVRKLYEKTSVEPDKEIWANFLPYSGLLNMDEVDDIEKKWGEIAEKIDISKDRLKEEIMPAAALYSIADHTRALLVAFTDGALPSNTGEKHSLRVIARRALDFVDRYGWDLDLKEVMEWHAEEMGGVFPELQENIEEAKEIMEHEQRKYNEMKVEAKDLAKRLKKEKMDDDKLIELYDSRGISPDMLNRLGFEVEKPPDFYAKVAERHEEVGEGSEGEVELDVGDLPKTEFLFRQDEKRTDFDAEVLKIMDRDGKKYVVLDRTCFYPESGGQAYDKGKIDGIDVKEVIKRGGVIVHVFEEVTFEEGDRVKGSIRWDRRKQLMQHHSATHLINGAAQEVLGDHVWQAGAKKTTEKARLDITHYDTLSEEDVEKIEKKANKWVKEGLPVKKEVMKKSEAEMKHGFRIYQGGVPPGNNLRILVVGDEIDVEACGGTHVGNTSEIEDILITSTSKVQDGVIRIEFKAGKAARKHMKRMEEIRSKLDDYIDTDGYSLDEISKIFDVPKEKLPKVVRRFVREWKDSYERERELLRETGEEVKDEEAPADPRKLFEGWKEKGKSVDNLEGQIIESVKDEILESKGGFFKKRINVDEVGELIRTAKEITGKDENKSVVLIGNNAAVASKGKKSKRDVKSEVEEVAKVVKEEGGLIKGFDLKDQ